MCDKINICTTDFKTINIYPIRSGCFHKWNKQEIDNTQMEKRSNFKWYLYESKMLWKGILNLDICSSWSEAVFMLNKMKMAISDGEQPHSSNGLFFSLTCWGWKVEVEVCWGPTLCATEVGMYRHVTSHNQGYFLEVERGPWERGWIMITSLKAKWRRLSQVFLQVVVISRFIFLWSAVRELHWKPPQMFLSQSGTPSVCERNFSGQP